MKLSEMAVKSAKKYNKLMESRFGFAINFDSLTVEKAESLSETISANLNKIRHSVDLHTAEKNPRYMELLAVRESINTWLEEQRTQLNEGEVGNAEVLLAAKNMVDSVQDAIEKVGKMQNEQLPELLDSIRDQIGQEQAEGFKNAVGTTLSTLMQNLQSAREGVDNGVRILSGEQVDNPMAMPGDDLSGGDTELPAPPASDLDSDETDGFGASDAAVGGSEELGRELR
jgi:molybdopterin converting factor small subunit